jgi:hypothetical protein
MYKTNPANVETISLTPICLFVTAYSYTFPAFPLIYCHSTALTFILKLTIPAPKRASTMGTSKKTNTASTPKRSATEPTMKKPKRTDTADPLPNFYDRTGKDKKKNCIKEVMKINGKL